MRTIYKILFTFSLLIILVSLILIFSYGLKFGIDFKGGSVFKIEFQPAPTVPSGPARDITSGPTPVLEKIRNVLKESGLENFTVNSLDKKGIIIKTKDLSEEEHQKILGVLKSNFGDFEEKSFESIGPVIGRELKNKSYKALIIALIVISFYLAVMFKKISRVINPWTLSAATIMAGVHDLLLPMALFSYLGKSQGIEIDASMIAAALTILGYSINDTIVVFDRIRENILISSKGNLGEVVHLSIKQTIFRSLSTTITTLLVLIAIFIYGGETLRNFILALMVGIASGAYSSIALASPLLIILSRKRQGN